MMIGNGLKRNEMLSGNGCAHLVIIGVSSEYHIIKSDIMCCCGCCTNKDVEM
jgi:hypothetical protein